MAAALITDVRNSVNGTFANAQAKFAALLNSVYANNLSTADLTFVFKVGFQFALPSHSIAGTKWN